MRPVALAQLAPRDEAVAVASLYPAPLLAQTRVQSHVRRQPLVGPNQHGTVGAGRHERLHERDQVGLDAEVDLCGRTSSSGLNVLAERPQVALHQATRHAIDAMAKP